MSLRARLLVASPALLDPNFQRTVVLLVDHGRDGALGLVLNRPSEMPVSEPLPGWEGLASEPGVVFLGGPVRRSAAICLGRGRAPVPVGGWTPLYESIGTVDLNETPAANPGIEAIRVFAGYAGWGPSQLEAELDEGSWVVCPPDPSDPLTPDAEDLWATVLARQPGLVPLLRRFPPDPASN